LCRHRADQTQQGETADNLVYIHVVSSFDFLSMVSDCVGHQTL
jgi:hypothetical protein